MFYSYQRFDRLSRWISVMFPQKKKKRNLNSSFKKLYHQILQQMRPSGVKKQHYDCPTVIIRFFLDSEIHNHEDKGRTGTRAGGQTQGVSDGERRKLVNTLGGNRETMNVFFRC
ncbi:hypothetical protein XENORESO_008233 [Xenotaenia resolanae]|uniref:Uncharacterized protein n=1 Tax=Xenotaenia resolanae TaxID=208358 RepID=A0ABV0WDW5_9TELE